MTSNPKMIRSIVLGIALLSFGVFAFQLYQIITQSNSIIEEAKTQTLQEAKDAAQIVENRFQNMVQIATETSEQISKGTIKYDEIVSVVGQKVMDNAQKPEHSRIGLTVAFEPYVYQDSARYAPYFMIDDNDSLLIKRIDQIYDYKVKTDSIYTDWYNFPMEQQKALWTEPHFGRAGNALFTGYQLPFYIASDSLKKPSLKKDKEGRYLAGVVCTDYRLDEIWQEVSRLGSGKTSYGFLITPNGIIVSYPMRDYLGKDLDELDLTTEEKEMLMNIPENISNDPAKLVDNQWVFYQEVPSTGWVLGIVYSQEEMLRNFSMGIRQKTISTTVAGVIALIGFIYIFFGAHTGNESAVWRFSTAMAIVCGIGMGVIWFLSMKYAHKPNYEEAIIYNESNIHSALGNLGISDDKAIYIPTGFFIQTIEFQGSNNLLVNGYIWQKFEHKGAKKPKKEPNIFFPESEDATYNLIQQDSTTMMWEFTVVLRQPFSYRDYPFDSEDIWLRVRSKGFDDHIYLTPDLYAYQNVEAHMKPGIADDLILGDWVAKGSYYSYRLTNYNSNLGFKPKNINVDLIAREKAHEEVKERLEPELFFNVAVQREFMSPFIGEVVPIIVVAFLVFSILLTQSRDEDKMTLTGFNSSSVLGYCASLYFILTVAHVYTREKLVAGHIVYIEYFYFVMYFILLWISLMSLLFVSDNPRYEVWNRNDAFLVKVLYWPLFFGIMFIATVIEFY